MLISLRNVLAQALLELHGKENVTQAPSNCNTSGSVWETGKRLFEYIRRQVLANGITGRVAFDAMGDRMYAEYEVINIQNNARGNNFPEGTEVGNYIYAQNEQRMKLTMEQEQIIWPGGLTKKPTGLMIPTHLKVLTILETPFVKGREVDHPKECLDDEVVCPLYDSEKPSSNGKKLFINLCLKLYIPRPVQQNFLLVVMVMHLT